MNPTIAHAVANGWIKFPESAPKPAPKPKRVLASREQFDCRLAWRLWNEGATLTYVARAIGVRRGAVMSLIREGRP